MTSRKGLTVKIQKAFKFELMPTDTQAAFCRRTVGACRFLWNKALAEQQRRHAAGEKRLNYVGLAKQLTGWRAAPETAWLAELPAQVQQQKLKDLERGFTNLFEKRAAPPRFRRRGEDSGFRVPQGFEVDAVNGRVKLPKVGWVRYRNHRRVEGTPRNLTVSSRAGRWYVSIQVELEVSEPAHPAPDSSVGIDAGVVRFATLSTGENLEPLTTFKKHEERLAWAQRKLARKKKGSQNWQKQKRAVQQLHARMADVRGDFLHKASHELTRAHGFIAIEDLDLRSMTKSAKGTIERPGRNVRAKSGLNKALLNHGFGEFRRQLEYKARWRGGVVVAVPPAFTSQTCPRCQHVSADNRRSQASFACVECGHAGNADIVAAENILTRARSARSACSTEASPPSSAESPASKSRSQGSRGRKQRSQQRDAAPSADADRDQACLRAPEPWELKRLGSAEEPASSLQPGSLIHVHAIPLAEDACLKPRKRIRSTFASPSKRRKPSATPAKPSD